ncbi:MSMEG_0570 family nitrogen starvation response protein [Ideonella azotifigens]|uniref:MSMEG_0570 family nitrogen starvation response protein n=1 Tax=Ideonella azotifigens TaxID=513160 RepID=A0ABN1K2C3_9BURK|nr:MSMEG_0570 family nitrogen starvation response protein [Ideonella azotifigens]MCD2343815.1 MSMEG_0570 family nitrogen starvation response protein [Ideonella azotifigens]
MPAMHYTVRWPDASETTCYSPSLVIQDFFTLQQDYPLPEFLRRLREATAIANERVQAKFGFTCSRASDQLSDTERRAASFAQTPESCVRLLAFGPAD